MKKVINLLKARPALLCMLLMAIVVLCLFGNVLFSDGENVLSQGGTDTFTQFVHWRTFGFSEMAKGNLPLWNPHVFSGAPYLAGFQSALLYPPNWIFLILPVGAAVNWSIALHVFLAGAFMYLWLSGRGLRMLSCFAGAMMMMFCGAHYAHIYAGHLPNLCSMVWAPLVLLSVDKLFSVERSDTAREYWLAIGRWIMLGALAVSMQILAGHPQYVFYTAVAVGIYLLTRIVSSRRRMGPVVGLFAIYAASVMLTAVQLLPGLDTVQETVRAEGVSYKFASMFSLPPENLITLAVPGFFGDMETLPYWGRCYLWEMNLFIGVIGLVLVLYGTIRRDWKQAAVPAVMVVVLLLFALGVHTPVFKVLYDYLPGFGSFRGSSKFIFPMSLFLILLAAMGMDRLQNEGRRTWIPVVGMILMSAVTALLGAAVWRAATGGLDSWWAGLMQMVQSTGEAYLTPRLYVTGDYLNSAASFAAGGLGVASVMLLLAAGLFALRRRTGFAVYGFVLLLALELVVFASRNRPTFELSQAVPPSYEMFAEQNPGDYRVFNAMTSNSGMSTGLSDIWGHDPSVIKRYAEFISFTQGMDPDDANQYVQFRRIDQPFRMLRCKFAFVPGDGNIQIREFHNLVPRVQLVSSYRLLHERAEILLTLIRDDFDPFKEVVLETVPSVEPVLAERQGAATIISESTDHIEIDADVASPSILLVTDAYSRDWKVSAVGEPVQDSYDIMPANYVLRAIPLEAGHHRLMIEYLPDAFIKGRWISIAAWLVLLIALVVVLSRARLLARRSS